MAGILNLVYSAAVLLMALVGVLFVFTRDWGPDGETHWSRWGTVAALIVFLVALVGITLSAA